MPQVATVKTPATPAQALGAIIKALPATAPRVAANIIAAESSFETANWQSMHNANMGNITPTAAQAASGPWMNQGLPMKYIAYPNILAGAQGMVGWLSSHGLLAYAYAGDIPGYVSKLASTCYMGCIGLTDPTGHTVAQADYDALQAALVSRAATLASVTPEFPPSGALGLSPVEWALVAAGTLGVGGVAYILATRHALG